MSNRFGGSTVGTNYRGNRAAQPPDLNFELRDPTQYDSQNHVVGDFWIADLAASTGEIKLWWLASLAGNSMSKGMLADWVLISNKKGDLLTLTGNNNTIVVSPDAAGNINVIGDAVGITIQGNAGTNTLTASLIGGQIAYSATVVTPVSNVTGDATPYLIIYDGVSYDQGGNYDNTTGLFTAPIAGIYHFDATAVFTSVGAGHNFGDIVLEHNGSGGIFGTLVNPANVATGMASSILQQGMILGISTDIKLAAGDTIAFKMNVAGSTKTVGNGAASIVSGHYVCAAT